MKIKFIVLIICILFSSYTIEAVDDQWVRLMQINKPDDVVAQRDWRIKDGWLEVDENAVDTFRQYSIKELIEEASDGKLPLFLVVVRADSVVNDSVSKQETSRITAYSFYSLDVFGEYALTYKAQYVFVDPNTKNRVNEIILLVKDASDASFSVMKIASQAYYRDYFIREEAKVFFEPFFRSEVIRTIKTGTILAEGEEERTVYKLKDEWTKPGQAQLAVAKLFQQEGNLANAQKWQKLGEAIVTPMAQPAQVNDLQNKLMSLSDKLKTLSLKL